MVIYDLKCCSIVNLTNMTLKSIKYLLSYKCELLLILCITAGFSLLSFVFHPPEINIEEFPHLKEVLMKPRTRHSSISLQNNRFTFSNKTNDFVQIFTATNASKKLLNSVAKYRCVELRAPGGETKICVYPIQEDVYVSGGLVRNGMFEEESINAMSRALANHPDMVVLDLGCNIGVFTIYAASLGRRVIAVDASRRNLLLLSRSLNMGKLTENVTLIWNAISDVNENVKLKRLKNNIGGTFVKSTNETNPAKVIKTITLDELIPLLRNQPVFVKMDIETYERKALIGGNEFFRSVNVGYVLLEFMWHRNQRSGKQICVFLTRLGFRPYQPDVYDGRPLKLSEYNSWPDNVLWSRF